MKQSSTWFDRYKVKVKSSGNCFRFCGLLRKAKLYHSSNSPSFETAIPIILSYFHIDLVIRQLLSIVSFGEIPKWDIIWYPFFIPSASWWGSGSILFTPGFLGWFPMIKGSVFSTFFCVFIHFIIVFAERKRNKSWNYLQLIHSLNKIKH